MFRTRRKFNSAFKAKVAIEAIKEQRTISELAQEFEIHPTISQPHKSITMVRYIQRCPTRTYVKSLTQIWLGPVGLKPRLTWSRAMEYEWLESVVALLDLAIIPEMSYAFLQFQLPHPDADRKIQCKMGTA